jgi:hypothetical protein
MFDGTAFLAQVARDLCCMSLFNYLKTAAPWGANRQQAATWQSAVSRRTSACAMRAEMPSRMPYTESVVMGS